MPTNSENQRQTEAKARASANLHDIENAEQTTRRHAVRPTFMAVLFGVSVATWPTALTLLPRNMLWVAAIVGGAIIISTAVLSAKTQRLKTYGFPLSVYGVPVACVSLAFSFPILLRDGGIPVLGVIAIWLVAGVACGGFTYWWLDRWARQRSQPAQ